MLQKFALPALVAALAAAPALAFNPQPDPPGRALQMADGSVFTIQPNGKVSEITATGKHVVAPPGTYKLKNGKVLIIEASGVISPASRAMLNPQPLPP